MKVPSFLTVLIPFVELVENTKDFKTLRKTPEWKEFRQVWNYWCYSSDYSEYDYYVLWWDLHDLLYAEIFGKARQNDLYRRILWVWRELKQQGLVKYG
jgi:hypothetical protein